MTGFRAKDHEIRHLGAPAGDGAIELAIVDKGDFDSPHDAGDIDVNDGNTLVRVRLLRGGHDDANKHRLLCRLDTRIHNLPDEGAQVMVAVPAAFGYSPGASVIIAVMGPNRAALPGLKADEPIMLGPAQNFVRLDHDGNVSLYTTDDGTADGKSVYAQVRPDGFRFVHPHGKMVLDKTGFHVLHSSGARVDLGAIGGLPPPLDALGSYAKLSAATVTIEGAAIALGTAAGAPDPVARATPTLAVLTALEAAVASLTLQLAALITGVGAIPTVGTAAAAGAVALETATSAAVTAATAALASATPLLPSNSTTST
jgi:hypothetical protein